MSAGGVAEAYARFREEIEPALAAKRSVGWTTVTGYTDRAVKNKGLLPDEKDWLRRNNKKKKESKT